MAPLNNPVFVELNGVSYQVNEITTFEPCRGYNTRLYLKRYTGTGNPFEEVEIDLSYDRVKQLIEEAIYNAR